MNAKIGYTLCMLLVAAPASAQTTAPAPVEAVVNGTGVYVRSGPGGPGAYPCAKLSAPAKVTIVDRMGEWLKIAPAPGCFSAITRTYLQVDPATKVGTVTGDNVWIRAAGAMRESNFFTLQVRVNKGDTLKVLGEAGEYYKVESPANAYFWISSQFVKRADGGALPPAHGGASETGAGAGETAVTGDGGGIEVTLPGVTGMRTSTQPKAGTVEVSLGAAPARQTPPATAAFNAAEKLLAAECAKPPAHREWGALLAQYAGIDTTGDNAYIKPYVDARVAYVKMAMEQREELRAVESVANSVAEREKRLKLDLAKVEFDAPTTRPVTAYAAQGVLLASDIYPGGPAAAKRYLVRDPKTYLITAYVQCSTGLVTLNDYLGKYVGVKGTAKFDIDLRLDVVEAREIIVLGDKVEMPTPPRPVVMPQASPALPPILVPAPSPRKGDLTPTPTPAPSVKVETVPLPTPGPKPLVPPASPPTPSVIVEPPPTTKPSDVRPEFDAPPEPAKIKPEGDTPTVRQTHRPEPVAVLPPIPEPARIAKPEAMTLVPPLPEPVVKPAPKPEPLAVKPAPKPEPVIVAPAPKPEPVLAMVAPVPKPAAVTTAEPTTKPAPTPTTTPAATAAGSPTTQPVAKHTVETEFD